MAQSAWRTPLVTVTAAVFPESKRLGGSTSQASLLTGGEILSNLPLQMSLFFNAWFSPFWIVTCLYMLGFKFASLAFHYKVILITIYIVMAIVEAVRLYLGYVGNLQEKVPELAGFWLLTLVIQLPLLLFLLLNTATVVLPLERGVHSPMVLFLFLEIFLGYWAIRIMIRAQAAKFHLMQFDDVTDRDSETHSKRD
ncbi:transmembrane protein 17B-like [Corticium candelabrum]|uniref:transmembrane protein 17B-like n=1 Tax=Corticium candelabrum TaxID=121492 RepID=UPI002E275B9F|nr:transmembrane protein 17B-like [Corticium candelabrum]